MSRRESNCADCGAPADGYEYCRECERAQDADAAAHRDESREEFDNDNPETWNKES